MHLEFTRLVDGLLYRFDLETEPVDGPPIFRRSDLDLWCRRLPDFGWCVVDGDGTVSSRPFDEPGFGDLPPEGIWVSRKGDKSYVYELNRLRTPTPCPPRSPAPPPPDTA